MLTRPGSSGHSSAASVQAPSPFAADTVRAEIRQAAIEQELIGRASLDCSPAGCTGEVEFYQRLAELGAHFAIDYGKCRLRYSLLVDQICHLICKLLWVAVLALMA